MIIIDYQFISHSFIILKYLVSYVKVPYSVVYE